MTTKTQIPLLDGGAPREAGPTPERIGPTRVERARTRSVIGPANGFVSQYDGVLNPYMGCSFGCSYCYASNFTHTGQDREEWGRWVRLKANAPQLMAEIPEGSLNGLTLYVSTATDPYQPAERYARITRQILEDMAARHPEVRLVIQTRSQLAVRDTDLMLAISQKGRVQVNMTVTTDDDGIRKVYEPGCPSIPARLRAIGEIQQAGVQACITMTPLLPLRDPEEFCRTLLATGVRRFIVQPFHIQGNGKRGEAGKFVAQTDRRALESSARHFGCGPREALERYRLQYRQDEQTLERLLPQLGKGRSGFSPPWPQAGRRPK